MFTQGPPGSRDPPAVDGRMSHSFIHSLHDHEPSLAQSQGRGSDEDTAEPPGSEGGNTIHTLAHEAE